MNDFSERARETAFDDVRACCAGQADRREPSEAPAMLSKKVFVRPALVIATLAAYGAYAHWREHTDALETQRQVIDFRPQVSTFVAKAVTKPVELTLPGETRAFDTASIYPRATGYIAERLVDIGTRVKQGDLLVRIDSPDL
jgi:HlyD family secretion protein